MTKANVIPLRPLQHNQQDEVFFTKDQITVGTKLRYFGRTNPDVVFTVTYIKSWHRSNKGNYYAAREEVARRLNDEITVVSALGKDKRVFSFAYLSYSAIWRIAT